MHRSKEYYSCFLECGLHGCAPAPLAWTPAAVAVSFRCINFNFTITPLNWIITGRSTSINKAVALAFFKIARS